MVGGMWFVFSIIHKVSVKSGISGLFVFLFSLFQWTQVKLVFDLVSFPPPQKYQSFDPIQSYQLSANPYLGWNGLKGSLWDEWLDHHSQQYFYEWDYSVQDKEVYVHWGSYQPERSFYSACVCFSLSDTVGHFCTDWKWNYCKNMMNLVLLVQTTHNFTHQTLA